MARTDRRGAWFTVAAVGLGMGFLAGFALAETIGKVDRKRVARAARLLGAAPLPAPLTPAHAAQAAAVALARTPALADLELEVRALGPGRVELLGWVPDRRHRALAERTVASIDGITGLVNRLLVEEEDSNAPVAELTLEGQSA